MINKINLTGSLVAHDGFPGGTWAPVTGSLVAPRPKLTGSLVTPFLRSLTRREVSYLIYQGQSAVRRPGAARPECSTAASLSPTPID